MGESLIKIFESYYKEIKRKSKQKNEKGLQILILQWLYLHGLG